MALATNSGSYYDVLGVAKGATHAQIRKAYLAKCLVMHPDKAGNTPAVNDAFNRLQEAYETLKDPSKRKEYDEEQARPKPAHPPPESPHRDQYGESPGPSNSRPRSRQGYDYYSYSDREGGPSTSRPGSRQGYDYYSYSDREAWDSPKPSTSRPGSPRDYDYYFSYSDGEDWGQPGPSTSGPGSPEGYEYYSYSDTEGGGRAWTETSYYQQYAYATPGAQRRSSSPPRHEHSCLKRGKYGHREVLLATNLHPNRKFCLCDECVDNLVDEVEDRKAFARNAAGKLGYVLQKMRFLNTRRRDTFKERTFDDLKKCERRAAHIRRKLSDWYRDNEEFIHCGRCNPDLPGDERYRLLKNCKVASNLDKYAGKLSRYIAPIISGREVMSPAWREQFRRTIHKCIDALDR